LSEQKELASYIPNSRLEVIDSPDGHDAFLIELEDLNRRVRKWRSELPRGNAETEERVRWDAA